VSFKAKVILDSINPHNGIRLITSELTYPRFIHAEFMTHRMFSRNAASSRAIPTRKMLKMVSENPAMPVYWGKNQKGMAAEKQLDYLEADRAERIWLAACNEAVEFAKQFRKIGLHKQIANRIVEPWKYITVICTATNHSNFFKLRDHEDAQPEIAHLARMWSVAQRNSMPVERLWHIPYIQDDEQGLDLDLRRKMGVARCARVSYLTHDGVRSIDKDVALYERLLTGSGHGHWSPFEHVAKATDEMEMRRNFADGTKKLSPIWCGNFQGWVQFRKMQRGECH
jgi:thymidylate synthase ThyX